MQLITPTTGRLIRVRFLSTGISKEDMKWRPNPISKEERDTGKRKESRVFKDTG